MTRPYSLTELENLEKHLYFKHRLSDITAIHLPCMHKYKVKRGGRKEQYLLDNGPILDDQTCSVCFKIRTVGNEPSHLVDTMAEQKKLSKQYLENLDDMYKWLYRHEYN